MDIAGKREKKTRRDDILAELKRRITYLEYQPGVLLNEQRISNEFNVSRTPIREIFSKLEKHDLVTIVPHVGTFVAPIDVRIVKYAYEIRKPLDCLAAKLAAIRASEEEIKVLQAIVERIKAYDIVRNYVECINDDQLFHKTVRRASKNPLLERVLDDLYAKIERFLLHIQYKIKNIQWYSRSLDEMLKAIRNHEAEAAGREAEKHTDFFIDELSKTFLGEI
ncbi:MAG: GntR family transcriptional regulator [Spirochaetia bacterium]